VHATFRDRHGDRPNGAKSAISASRTAVGRCAPRRNAHSRKSFSSFPSRGRHGACAAARRPPSSRASPRRDSSLSGRITLFAGGLPCVDCLWTTATSRSRASCPHARCTCRVDLLPRARNITRFHHMRCADLHIRPMHDAIRPAHHALRAVRCSRVHHRASVAARGLRYVHNASNNAPSRTPACARERTACDAHAQRRVGARARSQYRVQMRITRRASARRVTKNGRGCLTLRVK